MQSAMDTFCEIAIHGKDVPLGMSASMAWKQFSVDIEMGWTVELDWATDSEDEDNPTVEEIRKSMFYGDFTQGYIDGSSGIESRPEYVLDEPDESDYDKMVREFHIKGYVCKHMTYEIIDLLYFRIFEYNKSRIMMV